jgi:hypothetical protein
MAPDAVSFVDDDGEEVILDEDEVVTLLAITADLDAATVSACPTCRCRVLACVALVDLLEAAAPHPRARELIELADDAPTLHLYVEDLRSGCRHPGWRDPGYTEWAEALDDLAGPRPVR